MTTAPRIPILGQTFADIAQNHEVGPHNGKHLRRAYRQALEHAGAADPFDATPLPITRRVVDGDTTKFIQRTNDDLEIESVVIPMERSGRRWHTLCVSSQIGCARGCTFCETAQLGLLRNLTAAEIIGQVVAAQHTFGPVRNIVFMGMGEPLDNFAELQQTLAVLFDRCGLSFAQERIRISTVGRTRGIRQLATLGYRRIDLAVSLNAPNDAIRSQIMPVNDREPMETLRAALLDYPLRNCQFFMIEYVLIPGVNAEPEHARELAAFLQPLQCIVNVIPYNPRHESPWPAPSDAQVTTFLTALKDAGQDCRRRLTKGQSQMAACGQLGNRALARQPRRVQRITGSDTGDRSGPRSA
jgi:23S rRNA (adenine2503-C2)-methyltransferase